MAISLRSSYAVSGTEIAYGCILVTHAGTGRYRAVHHDGREYVRSRELVLSDNVCSGLGKRDSVMSRGSEGSQVLGPYAVSPICPDRVTYMPLRRITCMHRRPYSMVGIASLYRLRPSRLAPRYPPVPCYAIAGSDLA
eukprot:466584-Rhodomonas_salina.3